MEAFGEYLSDNGSIKNDESITWTLEVGAGETVSVECEVKVTADLL